MGFARAPRQQQPYTQENATPVASELDSFSAYGNSAAAEQLAQYQTLSLGHGASALGEEDEGLDPDAFLALGPYGPSEILPETGLGGFEAQYDPKRGVLLVTLRTGICFVDPVTESGDPTRNKFQGISDWVKQNPELISAYRWSEEATAAYEADLRNLIAQGWGGQFRFTLPWKGWEEIAASVEIDLQLIRTDRRLEGQHLFLEAVKLEPGSDLEHEGLRTNTQPKDTSRNDDQTMQLGSNDLKPQAERLGYWAVLSFRAGSAEVDAQGMDDLRTLAANAPSDPSFAGSDPFSANIEGYASQDGGTRHNQELSVQRANAARDALASFGFLGSISAVGRGERNSPNPDSDRIATVTLGDGLGQTAALHEFGHAFGLGDEYETRNRPIGAPATHNDLVKRMHDEQGNALPGAIHEPGESVMSMGDEVRPQHYATFFQALTELTGIDAWRIGAP